MVQKQSGTHGDSSEGSDAGQDYDYDFNNKQEKKRRKKNQRKAHKMTTQSPWILYGDYVSFFYLNKILRI